MNLFFILTSLFITPLFAQTPVKKNLSPLKILYVGDSHSVAPLAPFGFTMNTLLRAIPNTRVETHARCGSTLEWWYTGKPAICGSYDQNTLGKIGKPKNPKSVRTPKIAPILQSLKPHLIVIEMGGNYLGAYQPSEKFKTDAAPFLLAVKKLKADQNTRCVWVGPPSRRDPESTAKMPALIQTIQETVSPVCEFFDSSKVTQYPAATGNRTEDGDGTHYSFPRGFEIGVKWAEKAFEIIKKN